MANEYIKSSLIQAINKLENLQDCDVLEIEDKRLVNIITNNYRLLLKIYEQVTVIERITKEEESLSDLKSIQLQKKASAYYESEIKYIKEKASYHKQQIVINVKKLKKEKVSDIVYQNVKEIEEKLKKDKVPNPVHVEENIELSNDIEGKLKNLKNLEYKKYKTEYSFEVEKSSELNVKSTSLDLVLKTFFPNQMEREELPKIHEVEKILNMNDNGSFVLRQYYTKKAWSLLTEEGIKDILEDIKLKNIKKVFEIGSGSGALIYWLEQYAQKEGMKVKFVAIDNASFEMSTTSMVEVKDNNLEEILEVEDISRPNELYFILSWVSNSNNSGYELLKDIPVGSYMLHIGTRRNNITANNLYYNALDSVFNSFTDLDNLSFHQVEDVKHVYKKNQAITKGMDLMLKETSEEYFHYKLLIFKESMVLNNIYILIMQERKNKNIISQKQIIENKYANIIKDGTYREKLNSLSYLNQIGAIEEINHNMVQLIKRILVTVVNDNSVYHKNDVYSLLIYIEDAKKRGYFSKCQAQSISVKPRTN